MAKLKMLKYPKKPKTSASNVVKERYLIRCKEIDKENARRKNENQKGISLDKKIASIGRAR